VITLLKLFHAPFTAAPLAIEHTGPRLQTPVAIASHSKALRFASSNRERDPNLVAFHNQAVTSTKTFDDDLFASFGGVKHRPNAYNTAWIWPALSVLFADHPVAPPDLLNHLGERPFPVTSEPPPPRWHPWPWPPTRAPTLIQWPRWWRRVGSAPPSPVNGHGPWTTCGKATAGSNPVAPSARSFARWRPEQAGQRP
jgi:hypothetical protein